MEIDKYSAAKTAKKAAMPVGVVLFVHLAIAYLESIDIKIDSATVWEAALIGYGAIITLKNYLKNHKRGKAASG